MLSKVMKYEMKASTRLLLPFFGLVIAISAIFRLLVFIIPLIWAPSLDIIPPILSLINIFVMAAISIITFIALLARFYNSMLGTEGYLTFTLPVKLTTLLNGKIYASLLWLLISWITTSICSEIIMLGYGHPYTDLYSDRGFAYIHNLSFSVKAWAVFLFVLVAIVGAYRSLIKIYVSMGIGAQFGRNRIVGSILSYFIINTIEGFITIFIIFVPLGICIGSNTDKIEQYFSNFGTLSPDQIFNKMLLIFSIVILVAVLIQVIFNGIYYYITHRLFSKNLNLE